MRKWIDPDAAYEEKRERLAQSTVPNGNTTPPRHTRIPVRLPEAPESPRSTWRSGMEGWYDDFRDLAKMLDSVYGLDQWAIRGRDVCFIWNGQWCEYYRVIEYTSGRFYVYDQTKV